LRSGRHLLAVINDVLDLSKSEAGKMVLAVARDRHGRGLAGLRSPWCASSAPRPVSPSGVTGMDQPLPMTGDAAKLRQIFLNLLSNAIKFTKKAAASPFPPSWAPAAWQ
jgi:signal transduction histidine kinase